MDKRQIQIFAIATATMLFLFGASGVVNAAEATTVVTEALPVATTTVTTQSEAAPAATVQPVATTVTTQTSPSSAPPSNADSAQYQKWLISQMTAPREVAAETTTTTTSTTTTDTLPRLSQPIPSAGELPSPRKKRLHFGNSLVISPPMSYHESQEAMLNSVPSPATSPEVDTAFNMLMQQNMPLTPQQVIRLRQLIDQSQRAASTPATVPPKPVSTTIMMNLAPGTTPPAIRLAQGYVTSLVFVDSTGAPWPIASYDIGDPKTTTIQWDGKSNVLLIQAISPYGDSDLVIRLAGLMTPLTLELVSGQRVVDFRTDIHVSGIGPNAKDLPTGTALPGSANQLLLGVLDGVAPAGSKLLTVSGGDCQAWIFADKMYLRTRLTVLSPGWVGRMVSPDGMFAYEIQKTSTVLVSQYGEPIELKIEGF
ncbi:MAG: DotH/IcmK family type IV secretion protein [Gammaproteobacteria bacterium]|nr:DotH/IcmK family type IV secretion protein [Gammaproteobacteria bacterium]